MPHAILLTVYCVIIACASLLGGWLPHRIHMTHLRTQLLISFVAGLMLSIATYQFLPHSIEMLGNAGVTGGAVLGGILTMYLMLRAFHGHSHAAAPIRTEMHESSQEPSDAGASSEPAPDELATSDTDGPKHQHNSSHSHHCEHDSPHDHSHGSEPAATWVGMLIGLGVHSLMDGVALAASVAADTEQGAWLGLFGLGAFLAISMHKPLDSFAITSTMKSTGWSAENRQAVNWIYSCLSPAGVILFWVGANRFGVTEWVIGIGLAVSAGFFICIALADLLPEVQFHSHDRFKLTSVFLLGVSVAIAIEHLPGHEHDHDHGHQPLSNYQRDPVRGMPARMISRKPTPGNADAEQQHTPDRNRISLSG